MFRGRTRLLFVALVLVALVACGGGGDDDDTAAGTQSTVEDETAGSDDGDNSEIGDPCEIVTESDAEAVLGEPVEADPERDAPLALGQCVWNAVAADSFAQLQFAVYDGGSFYSEPTEGGEPFDVGDPAYIRVDDEQRLIDIQFVTKGTLVVVLFASDIPGPIEEARSTMEDIAAKVADSL